jgi:hypothetical protein
MLALLAMWLMPMGAAAAIHRVASVGSDARSFAKSLWAGFVAWATILFVTMTTGFVMLVIHPPHPHAAWSVAAVVAHVSSWVSVAVWIALAAYVHELESAARDQ